MKIGEMKDYRDPEVTDKIGLNVGNIVISPSTGGKYIIAQIEKNEYTTIRLTAGKYDYAPVGGKRSTINVHSEKISSTSFTTAEVVGLLGPTWRDWEVVDD